TAAGLDAEDAAAADPARPERPGRNRPDSAQREHAVDVEPRRRVVELTLQGDAGEGGPQLVETGSRLRAHRNDLGTRNELSRLVQSELECLRLDRVDLGDRDDSALDSEQPQDGEVLVRLRARALRRTSTTPSCGCSESSAES